MEKLKRYSMIRDYPPIVNATASNYGVVSACLSSDVSALEARLQAAEKALAPFADFGKEYIGNVRGLAQSGAIYGIDFTGTGGRVITVEMFIAAIAALAEIRKGDMG